MNKGMNLYKVFCALGIVIFHATFKAAGYLNLPDETNFFLVWFLMLGEIGVNGFFLISGFYLKENSFKVKKLIELFGILYFYKIFTYLAYCLTNNYSLGTDWDWFNFVNPGHGYWFFSAYILLYILSPYTIKFFNTMSLKENAKFILIISLIWIIVPSILGMKDNNPESFFYYSRFILGFIVQYIGIFLKKSNVLVVYRKQIFLTLCLLLIFLQGWMFFFSNYDINSLQVREDYWWRPNNIFTIGIAIGLMMFPINYKLPTWSPNFSSLASTTLGIYLLHDSIWNKTLWTTILKVTPNSSASYILLVSLLIVLIAFIIDKIRQLIFKVIGQLYTQTLYVTNKKDTA